MTIAVNRSTHLRVIERLDRLANTASGNPRWGVHFADGTSAATVPDADVNHGITNYQGMPVVCTFEAHQLAYVRPAMSEDIHSPFGDMAGVRRANAYGGGSWFDPAAMAHFATQVETDLIRGRLFVTSDQWLPSQYGRDQGMADGERRFTLRYAMDDGGIETVGTFQQYATIGEAVTAALEFGA